MSDHDIYAMLLDMAALERDEAGIRQYAPQAEELAGRYSHTLYQAVVHRAWGVAHRLAGEYTESKSRLRQALDLFNSLNTRWQIGRTLYELGELALVQADAAQAREYLNHALAAFQDMRAAPDVARTQACLGKAQLITVCPRIDI